MIAKTSISALRALLFLARQDRAQCWSPRRLAELLGESPTYLAKVMRHLVKSAILEAEKGAKGGVRLALDPASITLLQVVEACQGTIVGDFCRSSRPESAYCSFHQAASELHQAVIGVLGRWTLHDLGQKPEAASALPGGAQCVMSRGLPSGLPALVTLGDKR